MSETMRTLRSRAKVVDDISRGSKDEKTTPAIAFGQPKKVVRKLLHWNDLPHWQRDNQHIHQGYRPASFSYLVSFQSLCYIHNETVNIYTHLLPSLVSLPCSYWLYWELRPRYETASHHDVLAFACFFLGVVFCLGMSATYHTISNHSPMVARIGNALDYVGIVGLITGSFIPSMYYGFYCSPIFQRLYWGMVTTIGIGCACVCVIPRFRTPDWRVFRASMFVSMGLSAVFPVAHGLMLYGVEEMTRRIGLFWVFLQGFLYILGAAIYAARIPERLRPGKFDILGSSHQIFHVLVVCASVSHLTGLLQAFDYRHSGIVDTCDMR